MKKFLLAVSAVVLLSCSDDSSDSTNSVTEAINPPSWAIGTWYSQADGISTGIGYKISEHDFCTVLSSTQNCWREVVNSTAGQITVTEQKSDTDYTITMSGAGSNTTVHFRKISATQINTVSTTGSQVPYYK